jgi:hypothetical protein
VSAGPERQEGRLRLTMRLVAGGVVGAALVLNRRRGRLSGSGLRAFEDAPCFRAAQQAWRRPPGPGDEDPRSQ